MTQVAVRHGAGCDSDADLRAALAAEVAANVASGPPGLESALGSVPRRPFLSCIYRPGPPAEGRSNWTRQTPETVGERQWAEAIHSDLTQITEVSACGLRWRTSLAPSVLATLWSLAGVRSGRRILEVGTGSGYGAAVLGELAGSGEVHTVEWDAAAADRARRAISSSVAGRPGVHVHHGAPDAGYPPGGPYDCIVLNGSAPYVPWGLADQLAEGGRMVMDWRGRWGGAVLVLERKQEGLAGRFVSALPGALAALGPAVEFWDQGLCREPLALVPAGSDPANCGPESLAERRYGVFFEAELPFVAVVRDAHLGSATSSLAAHDRMSSEVAWFEAVEGGGWAVRGPRRLASRLQAAIDRFGRCGRPENSRFVYLVGADAQWVVLANETETLQWRRALASEAPARPRP